MPDIRVTRMAKLLVQYSASIKPGDKVLIEAQPVAEPLIRELAKEVLEAGAYPQILLSLSGLVSFTGLDDLFYRHAKGEQLDIIPPFYKLAYETFDSRFRVHSLSNSKALTNVNPDTLSHHRRTVGPITETQFTRGASGAFKWVTTQYPTQSYAQDADMSLEEYEDFLFGACFADLENPVAKWREMGADQEAKVAWLEGHDKVEVRGPNCELTCSIKDRIFKNSCGKHNMPDGEIFTGPVETSMEGWVRFTYPAIYGGAEVDGVELHFEKGRVVKATAKKNEEHLLRLLDTDAGSRYLGEFAIGTNFGIKKFTHNILFDEKIGGSIHMAVGRGYPETGSVNESSIHWDMICDMGGGAEILVDGELFYRDGNFVV
ncbi:MAG: aminopeptidase [Anaerolineales bacterium]|nr:aminopeptidase [Anaerolineales bacterium]